MQQLLHQLLAIPSPTFEEQEKRLFIEKWIQKECPMADVLTIGSNLIANVIINPEWPTVALVGHTDVVPKHFEPYVKKNKLYGAGASDMQAGLAACLAILKEYKQLKTNIVFIAYAREEGTPLVENGLYECINAQPELFKSIDCAIVGEPTDNTIQCGCVGSLHAKVTIKGKAAHSARPWHGDNALYKSLPLIELLAKQQPQAVKIKQFIFTDVLSITEATVSKGRTTVPDSFTCNINVRFAPDKTSDQVMKKLNQLIDQVGINNLSIELVDTVPAGKIIESPFFNALVQKLNCKLEAKQAWTDVAQLTQLGIPAFNFGPGHQSEAHKPNECVDLTLCEDYYHKLKQCLTTPIQFK